jgi:hypothetical protein
MNRPFTAKRRRRCAWPGCPHGGVIRPGDKAVRVTNHAYLHADDGAALGDVFARLARDLPLIMDWIGRVFSEMAAAISAGVIDVARAIEGALGRPDDQLAYDLTPAWCWRCDAVPAETDLGLCSPCSLDLGATA